MKRTLFKCLVGALLLAQMAVLPVFAAVVDHGTKVNESSFPDANFRNWILEQDYGADGRLTEEEIAGVTRIDVYDEDIASLKGIEYFTALKDLACDNNQLTELDVTQNPALIYLYCSSNQLTELDVTKNSELEQFFCYSNQLTELDVTQNPALIYLVCDSNQLTELDVTQNPALSYLGCNSNQLTELDVTQNPALENLDCDSNQLTELDVTQNPALAVLDCSSNQLTSLDLSKNKNLSGINVSGNAYSIQVDGKNQFTLSDLPGSFDVSKASNWVGGTVTGGILTATAETVTYTYDLGNGQGETFTLKTDYPKGIAVDESNFPDANFRNWILAQTYGKDGVLTAAEIAGVTQMSVSSQNIASLIGIEHFNALRILLCSGNQLTELDLTQNTELYRLECGSNQLTELDLTQNTELYRLDCGSNQLTELDLTQNTALTTLYCYSNQLTELDVTKNPMLGILHCHSNQLTELNVTQNSALRYLYCYSNPLTELNVTQNSELKSMDCSSNQLTELDVTKNAAMEDLNCSHNQLTKLDVTQNTALVYLYCDSNQLTSLDVSNNRSLFEMTCNGNSYAIVMDAKNQLTLSDLPGSFDVSKASNWVGGTVTDGILTATAEKITYTYDLGNRRTATFTLNGTLHTHTEVTDEAKEPTCKETGLTEGSHCDTCQKVLVAQEVVPTVDHSYEDGKCKWCGRQLLKITSQPKSVTVAEGEKAIVTLTAEGDGLIYKWYFKNAGDTKYTYTSSFKSNTYSVQMNDARSGRRVLCKVYDQYGNMVQSKSVTINMVQAAAVKITAQPKSVTVAEGEKATVSFTASGVGLTYQWYFKDASSSKFSLTTSFTSNKYSVAMTAARDGRQVYCVVTDKYNNKVQTNTVTISMEKTSEPVKITAQPKSVTVAEGEKATVTFTASGEGLVYEWYFKDTGATKFSKTTSFVSNKYSVAMTEARDGRQVYCVVTDANGNTAQTDTVTLSMKKTVTLAITSQPKSATAAMGDTVKVSITAKGDGLSYAWYIKNPGKTSFSKSSVTSSTYSCKMSETTNGRQVYCIVTDVNGNTAKSNTVTVSVTPVKITSQPASIAVAEGATAKVSVSAAGDGLTYTWYIKNPGKTSFSKSSVTSATYSCKMSATTDGRQVYCIVTDVYGNTAKSNTVTLSMQ